jgi:lipopolysaccharide/colanic/teichoic acid biosynthesis glycosyltransferase
MTRLINVLVSAILLVILIPLVVCIAAAIKLDSRGPVFYRCRRVGFLGRDLLVLKFRKMHDGASGPALTLVGDGRFTRVGAFLAASKLDEIPQLWNVLKGEMSLVGPRPEDASFVRLHEPEYQEILRVKPGITGLCQLAFAREGEMLDRDDRLQHYVERLLPQKVALDLLYAARRSVWMDLWIVLWTAVPVLLRQEVAVHRATGELGLRRRAHFGQEQVPAEAPMP